MVEEENQLILTLADTTHSETEERWFSIGLANNGMPMSISYLWTDVGAGLIKIRLIIARGQWPRRFVSARKTNDKPTH